MKSQNAIGREIRDLRGRDSQEFVAANLKISKSALAMYERGERMPRDEVKIRISDYFGKSVQSLFFDEQEYK